MTWGEAFLWTVALETPVYALLLRRSFRREHANRFEAWAAAIVVSIALQLLTHPALWWLWPMDWPYWDAFFLGESIVCLVEGLALSLLLLRLHERRPFVRGFVIAFLANALSASIGLLF